MNEENVMDRLKAGARKFQTEVYAKNAEHYERGASRSLKPRTLIIGE